MKKWKDNIMSISRSETANVKCKTIGKQETYVGLKSFMFIWVLETYLVLLLLLLLLFLLLVVAVFDAAVAVVVLQGSGTAGTQNAPGEQNMHDMD